MANTLLKITFLPWLFLLAACATPAGPQVDASQLEKRSHGESGDRWYLKGETQPFTGIAVLRRADGHLEARAPFRDGQMHGQETRWHANGKIAQRQDWHHGKRHGHYQLWDDEGHRLVDNEFADGLPVRARSWFANGRQQSFQRFADGEVIFRQEWDPDGSPRAVPGFNLDGSPQR